MIYHALVTSALLVASVLVQASPAFPRNDEFASEFLNALNEKGLTKMCKFYSDFFQTDQGPKLISTLKSKQLAVLVPNNEAFGDCEASFGGNDNYTILNYFNVEGFDSSKRAPAQSRSVHATTMPRQNLRKRAWNNQVQVVDTQFGGSKRWNEPTIFFNQVLAKTKVLSQTKFKNLDIFETGDSFRLPTKIDDVLCKPLVESAPNGFTKLGQALYKTGLMDTVNDALAVTLFAPIDKAFEDCDDLSNDQLASILKNHVLSDITFSPYFPYKSTVTATSGKKLKFEKENGTTYVSCGKSKATVIRSDVTTTNGVVHVIDALLKCD